MEAILDLSLRFVFRLFLLWCSGLLRRNILDGRGVVWDGIGNEIGHMVNLYKFDYEQMLETLPIIIAHATFFKQMGYLL